MFKRLLALLLTLLILTSSAMAEGGSIATYTLPDGAEVLPIYEADAWVAPKGLESMYAFMLDANINGDIYLARMPNGRALASISCTHMSDIKTADGLLALWPQIAQAIQAQGVTVDASAECAQVATRFHREALQIQTTVTTADGLELRAEGVAFYHDMELMEIWTVYPVEEEKNLFSSDVETLKRFIQSFTFDDIGSMQTTPYIDPDGRYTLQILSDAAIITADTPPEEVAAIRESFVAANKPGADHVFDVLMEDVCEEKVLLIFTADRKGVAQVFVSRVEAFAGFTADDFRKLAPALSMSLKQRFGAATLLDDDSTAIISGATHSWMGYWVQSGECGVQLDIIACVPQGDWLCEVDIYTAEGDGATRSLLYSLLSQTLQYTFD